MIIGIIGNMNNAYFSLSRYLRDRGFNCKLLIFNNEPKHFDPSCDTSSDEYRKYCKKLSWGDPAGFLTQDFEVVRKDLEEFDFLIGNGPAPAYTAKVDRFLDIFMPYGYDLYSLPFIRLVHPVRLPAYLATAYYQRKGIRECGCIFFDRTNKEFESVFKKLRYRGRRIVCANPMIYYKEYENIHGVNGAPDHGLAQLRKKNDLLFVQHARQMWKSNKDHWSGKGNDELVKGYAKFIGQNPSIRSKLILFEYGSDVDATKKLVYQLGIDQSVHWLPKMSRKELMHVLRYADVVIGELYHSWLTYGVALEALSVGKPLMHFRKDEEFRGDYPELYPMLHAHSADTVLAGLMQVAENPSQMREMGRKGKEWFLKYCVERSLDSIAQLIIEKQQRLHA